MGVCRPVLDIIATGAEQRRYDLREVFNALRWLFRMWRGDA